jgi:hypothetical protein
MEGAGWIIRELSTVVFQNMTLKPNGLGVCFGAFPVRALVRAISSMYSLRKRKKCHEQTKNRQMEIKYQNFTKKEETEANRIAVNNNNVMNERKRMREREREREYTSYTQPTSCLRK